MSPRLMDIKPTGLSRQDLLNLLYTTDAEAKGQLDDQSNVSMQVAAGIVRVSFAKDEFIPLLSDYLGQHPNPTMHEQAVMYSKSSKKEAPSTIIANEYVQDVSKELAALLSAGAPEPEAKISAHQYAAGKVFQRHPPMFWRGRMIFLNAGPTTSVLNGWDLESAAEKALASHYWTDAGWWLDNLRPIWSEQYGAFTLAKTDRPRELLAFPNGEEEIPFLWRPRNVPAKPSPQEISPLTPKQQVAPSLPAKSLPDIRSEVILDIQSRIATGEDWEQVVAEYGDALSDDEVDIIARFLKQGER